MNLSDIIKGLFNHTSTKSEIDLSQPVFYGKQFRQNNYDREIDEGMSSGLERYITLDVTDLSEKQLSLLINTVVDKTQDFSLCKMVQVAGFKNDEKKYLAISGESHRLYSNSVKSSMHDRLKSVFSEFPVTDIVEFIPVPINSAYTPTNLG
ncbi:MAG: hypothetical protein ACP5N1_05625, partial [Candidatus Woesearchaeota archaeon]